MTDGFPDSDITLFDPTMAPLDPAQRSSSSHTMSQEHDTEAPGSHAPLTSSAAVENRRSRPSARSNAPSGSQRQRQQQPLVDSGSDPQPEEQPPQLTLEELKALDRKEVRNLIVVLVLFVVGIAAAVSGTIVGLNREDNPDPTSFTQAPTFVPTTPDTRKECFTNIDVLQAAIRSYMADPENATLAELYGSPIGTWCTSPMTSFRDLFKDMATFNEDISGWDTSSVVDMVCVRGNQVVCRSFCVSRSLCSLVPFFAYSHPPFLAASDSTARSMPGT